MLQMHLQLGLEYCKKLLFTNKKRKPNEAKIHKKVKGTCAVSRNRTELNSGEAGAGQLPLQIHNLFSSIGSCYGMVLVSRPV